MFLLRRHVRTGFPQKTFQASSIKRHSEGEKILYLIRSLAANWHLHFVGAIGLITFG